MKAGWEYLSGDEERSEFVRKALMSRAPKYRKNFKRFARMYQGHIQDVLTLYRFLDAAHFHLDIATEMIDNFLDHIQDRPYKDLDCRHFPHVWDSNFFMPAGHAMNDCPVYIVTPALLTSPYATPDEIQAYCQFVCRINEEYQYGGKAQRMYLIIDFTDFNIKVYKGSLCAHCHYVR